VKENDLHDGFEDEFDSYSLNEDKVVDYLEDFIDEKGGMIVGLLFSSFKFRFSHL
jgi:broad-specificity NMP kinase